MAYNANPSPQSGSGPFGSVPGAIPIPQPYQNVGHVFPQLQAVQGASGSDILGELEGQLSPETLQTIQNQGAAFGVNSGMGPGSGVQNHFDLMSAANASQGLQQGGIQNYGRIVGPSAQYLTVAPSVEAQIAEDNAINAAAPNPTLAGLANIGSYIGGLGWSYALNQARGGGTSGVSYGYAGGPPPAGEVNPPSPASYGSLPGLSDYLSAGNTDSYNFSDVAPSGD